MLKKTVRQPKLQLIPVFQFKTKKAFANRNEDEDPTIATTTTVSHILTGIFQK